MIYRENYELKKHTTFKIGGAAKRVYFPENVAEFAQLLEQTDTPIVLGGASNVLVSSRGVSEDVVFTTNLSQIDFDGNLVMVEAGVKGQLISKLAKENSLSGVEFMIGFPGTVGGMVYMNASAHNQSVCDVFVSADFYDKKSKKIITLLKEDMQFSYRNSVMKNGNLVLLRAVFKLSSAQIADIDEIMQRNIQYRKNHQPNLAKPNAGSVFKNPENDYAARLLDLVDAKGMKVGGACVYENHANFITNFADATSEDVSLLMKNMYNKVYEKYSIKLVPEVVFLGDMSEVEKEIWEELLSR